MPAAYRGTIDPPAALVPQQRGGCARRLGRRIPADVGIHGQRSASAATPPRARRVLEGVDYARRLQLGLTPCASLAPSSFAEVASHRPRRRARGDRGHELSAARGSAAPSTAATADRARHRRARRLAAIAFARSRCRQRAVAARRARRRGRPGLLARQRDRGREADVLSGESPMPLAGTVVRRAAVRGRPGFLFVPVGLTSLNQGQRGSRCLFWLGRGLCGRHLPRVPAAPPRLRDLAGVPRLPRRPSTDDLVLEAGTAAAPPRASASRACTRAVGTSFLLVVMDRRDLRCADRAARVVWLVATRIPGCPVIPAVVRADQVRVRNRDRAGCAR